MIKEVASVTIKVIAIPASQWDPMDMREIAPTDLNAYQALVGGPIESIDLENPSASLYLNEEGKLRRLPHNVRATHILWAHNERLRLRDRVVGDAFIAGPVDRRAANTAVPRFYVDLLLPVERFRVEVLARGEHRWAANKLEFDTRELAFAYANDLWQRWTLADKLRVVPLSTPKDQPYEEGTENIGSP
jgi:hypothetical protein